MPIPSTTFTEPDTTIANPNNELERNVILSIQKVTSSTTNLTQDPPKTWKLDVDDRCVCPQHELSYKQNKIK